MNARKPIRARQARRVARYRAGAIVAAALENGWNPDDLVRRYGQQGVDEIIDQLGDLATWLMATGHPDGTPTYRRTP